MSSRFTALALALAMVLVGLSGPVHAQGVTGQLAGTVTDATGGVMPGVTITVKNVNTQATREAITGARGEFLFPDLLGGTFDLTASLEGFKTFEQKGIVVASTDRVQLRTISLEVGGLTETISVQAEAVQVQTTSGARQSLVTRQNLEDIALKGRDFADMLKVLPGVIDTRIRDAPGWESMNNITINGQGNFNYTYDGVTSKDTGQNRGNFAAPALDSIAEVRVQASNFNAEYGRSSGATISVITRSGTQNFRGSAAYYKRDDSLNGNEYTRRVACAAGTTSSCDAAYYKYDNYAWTLGGPVLFPNFNQGRNKLFFFFSQDILHRQDPGNLSQRRVPTALERQGDFSQTRDAQGRLIYIRDPLKSGNCSTTSGGPACFTGNIIPADRIDKNGQALLNLLPMPNTTDPTGRNDYNYVFQTTQNWPRNDQVLRVDWNVTQRTQAYARLQFGKETRSGGVSILGSGGGWPQMATRYDINTVSWVSTVLHTFSPTLFGEFTVGVNWSHQNTAPFDQAELDKNDRTQVLPGLTQFFPNANPMNLVPQASFGGGIQGTIGSLNLEQRFPFFGYNTLFNFSTNITKAAGPHAFKLGLFVEHTTRPAQRTSNFNGDFSFAADSVHPLNTNVGMANALLGAVNSYTESDGHPQAHGKFIITEWYAQDTWRMSKRFTLDYGLRFYYMQPTQSAGDQVAQFEPGIWSAAAAPSLFVPFRNASGRVAQDPRTGLLYPAVYIGRLVPGSGDFNNGMQVYEGTPQSTNPFRVAPRVAFAWDVRGDGKTAVRGGAGLFYDRYQDDEVLQLVQSPPLLNTWRTNFTTINELLRAPLTATPSGQTRVNDFTPPFVYNWSLGVQRNVGLGLIADAAYVGNAQRNQIMTFDLNSRPYGYQYLPSSLDQTNVSGGKAQPLPTDFLRPYQGWGRIQQRQFTGYNNYHALQLALNRGRSRLRGGVSYTYQISSKGLGTIDPYVQDNAARNYTQNGRRPHVLSVNYSYDVPNLSAKWNNVVAKVLADNWQISGMTSWQSGTYAGLSYRWVNTPTGAYANTGGIDTGNSRVVLLCDPNLPGSEQTFTRQFKTECVAPPSDQYMLGTATNDELLGKSWSNWDISLFKNIPMGGTRRLQLRFEFYNAFNTDQFTGRNTSADFDWATKALVNTTTFGTTQTTGNATNPARRIQLGARFTF